MKTTIELHDFREAFDHYGRADNFSYEGLEVLFDYLEQYEQDTGEDLELDVIGLCCDYNEDTVDAIAQNYSIDLSACEDDNERADAVCDYLYNHTTMVGEVSGGFVYAAF